MVSASIAPSVDLIHVDLPLIESLIFLLSLMLAETKNNPNFFGHKQLLSLTLPTLFV